MNLTDSVLRLSATDLANHLACRHLTDLNFAKAHGLLEPPYWHDPMLEILRKRGDEHEAAYLEHLASRGIHHVRIGMESATMPSESDPSTKYQAPSTLAAMQAGARAIVQASLGSGGWGGYADVLLRRDDKPSDLGNYSYEVVDTKLARETKGGTILQLCLYTELVAELQGIMPEFMYVVSPGKGFEPERFRVAEYMDYYQMVKRALEETARHPDNPRHPDEGGTPHTAWGDNPRHPDEGGTPCHEGGIPPFGRDDSTRRPSIARHVPTSDVRLRTPDVFVLYPEPCEHCSICRWWKRCNDIRRADDHLTFVAGISKSQIRELKDHNVSTLADLAVLNLPIPWRPERGSRDSIERVHHQARLQLQQKTEERPVHELLPLAKNEGLARLPEPSNADIFFDLESARFVGDHGLQYLWGMVTSVIPTTEAQPRKEGSLAELGMTAAWAGTVAEERACFERFMDFVMQQRRAFPDLHIYHFGHYEPTTLKQLAQRHATREEELDDLLRAEAFVDLHMVVKQALRAGVEQYSLKDLEPFFEYEREMDLQQASKARHDLERGLEMDIPLEEIPEEVRDQVLRYNEDDCRATEGLRRWLEKLRFDLIAEGAEIPRPVTAPNVEEEEREGRRKDQRDLAERLLRDIPTDPDERSEAQQAQWLLGNMIQFHWREEKASWWEYFRMRELSDAEYFDEQTALAGLEFIESLPLPPRGRSPIHRYRFPAQESKIREENKLCYGDGEILKDAFGEVVTIDYAARTIDIKKSGAAADIHPTAVFEFSNVPGRAMEDAISRAGTIVVEDGLESENIPRPQFDLLMGHPPRFKDGFRERIGTEDESGLAVALRLVMDLDGGILPIQGPPGTGKTYIGGYMTCALVQAGKRVGVVANSHKVIINFLDAVLKASDETGLDLRIGYQPGKIKDHASIESMKNYGHLISSLNDGEIHVAGGTAWMWAREDFYRSVDVLFVDEAGQMALANVLASAQGAQNVVLLGDPQQLDQPQKGSHPQGVEVSALEHFLAGAETMPNDRGLFLEKTWRLSEPICNYTSDLFYQGRLEGIDKLANLAIHAPPLIERTGLYFLPVEHAGNQSACGEEAEALRWLVDALLGAFPHGEGEHDPAGRADNPTWTDCDGVTHPLTLNDILIVAPYNAQVSDIAALLPEGARVGTVDKFQGQEAPVVIYSMTTSSREDAPRGMEFLYSLNRLNVATSRAKCACILVANPAVLAPDCRNPRQIRLASAFCAYHERATDVIPGSTRDPV
ncbi:MAG TPA: TM0106 family RecB-like putative nuclease [Rhodothermales bacterium]|nr:TM0106 family RecB-like putative nuclease [Rhodothermales bacterium]